VSGVDAGEPHELLWSLFPAEACRVSFLDMIATNWSICTEEGAVKEKNEKG